MPRLFIAIDTPESVRPVLIYVRDRLKAERSDVRWESDEKLHCTLKFLGDTKDEIVPRVVASLKELCQAGAPLTLTYTGLGCFPDRRDPRIVWAGIHDSSSALAALTKSIDMAMSSYGFEREKRPFHPHVTIGRVKGRRGLKELIATLETITFDCPPVVIQEILLVKSELRPSGSVYSILERTTLGV